MSKNIFNQRAINGMQEFSKYIAIVVRNAMEDFHCNHVCDKQMKELNPKIRNSIYTAIRIPPLVDSKILGKASIAGWL